MLCFGYWASGKVFSSEIYVFFLSVLADRLLINRLRTNSSTSVQITQTVGQLLRTADVNIVDETVDES